MENRKENIVYHFDVEFAKRYGVDGAIMLYYFEFWIFQNRCKGMHFHDGRTWTYGSIRFFSEIWPFWKPHHIYREIKKIVKKQVLIEGNYNRAGGYDRTKWYAFKDEESWFLERESILQKRKMEIVKMNNPYCKSKKPIPNPNTDISTDINQLGDLSRKAKDLELVLEQDNAIADRKRMFFDSLHRIFSTISQKEQRTFNKVANYLVGCCQNGKYDFDIFDQSISWMKEAKQDGKRPKALFVSIIKKRTGFRSSKDLREGK
ncbi:MAG: hypothetical protein ACYS6K_06260 [Planctomycetota bacterium]|jgi:hypothetical protein